MIVLKFGGSSIDSPQAVATVAARIRERRGRQPVVVVSAMGLTTRRLLAAAGAAAAGDLPAALTAQQELLAFHRMVGEGAVPADRHGELARVLACSFDSLRELLENLATLGTLSPRDADRAVAYGELLASEILALALPSHGVPAAWVDCRRVVVTDDGFTRARPDESRTSSCLRATLPPLVAQGLVPVVGGYVGATVEGVTTTLGKEGSDFSAALVGAALGAEEIQLWTDVDGILTADPRIVADPRRVQTLSFGESLELARSGAKKPHPGTLGPAGRCDVPIRVLNTRRPEGEGTLVGRRKAGPPRVKSIACRRHDQLLNARPLRSDVPPLEFAERVLAVVDDFRPALLVVEVGESGFGLALDRGERLPEIAAALAAVARVEVAPGQAVVSLVSEDLATSGALAAEAFAAVAELAPRLVTVGVGAPVVRGLVADDDVESVVRRIHARLFSGVEEVIP